MNSTQRRKLYRRLEEQYGHDLTQRLITARLLDGTYVRLATPMPDVWAIDYVVKHRLQALKALATYDQAHRLCAPA